MGNVDSRCKHDKGYLMVQTAQAQYYPGQQVTGTIFLRTFVPVEAQYIELEIMGKEKASFETRVNRDNEWHDEKHKTKKTLWHFKQPCFTFAVPILAAGDYAIPFSFQLPSNIPSSVFYKNKHIQGKPKAMVKYLIRAALVDHHKHSQMKYKQVLIVREYDQAFQTNLKSTSENQITTGCCVNQGTSRLEVEFEKNVFEPTEVCRASVNLDNSRCNVALTNVRLAVEQTVWIQAQGHTFSQTFTLSDRSESGVDARHQGVVHKHLELPLSTIRYEVSDQKKKGGHMKPISQEDLFMMRQIQPACHGHHVRIDYHMTVRCAFQGCTCCAALPHAKIPLSIVPIVNPSCTGYQQPQDFNPHYYDAYSAQVHMQH
eukprot:403356296